MKLLRATFAFFLLLTSPVNAGIWPLSIQTITPYVKTVPSPSSRGYCANIFKPQRASLVTDKGAQRVIGYGKDGQKLRNALAFLAERKQEGQYRLVATFEVFARLISIQSGHFWEAYRFLGPNGEVGYVGTASHALVFTADGEILAGHLTDDRFRFTADTVTYWDGSGSLTPILPTK